MQHHRIEAIEAKELVPGFAARFVHAENMTFAYWDVAEGALLPSHDHPHEQVVNILAGRFELTVEDDTRILDAGDVVVIPSNAAHSGRALAECRILDVFHPVREDYR
jgi:quercetin dioxygenase-like cupin family protein